ncbi:MAG: hypothetical protein P8N52_03225 [Crocinitomicaceae bacterium]|nr:hypothetical protein [Crocinitomicaceae bacterium]MDG1777290.1 hypothetical protein [Crocinitomicaceae bacterium]
MKFRFLNKTINNQRFNYTPMYFDERKQRLKRKKAQYQELENTEMSDYKRKEMLRDSLQEGWNRAAHRQNENKSSNIRILALIVILVGLGYFIFNGVDEVDTVVTKIW